MGLLDPFSDKNEKQAADVVDKAYKKGNKQAKKNLNKGFKGLENNYAKALNEISTSADTARGDIAYGRDQGVGALTAGRDQGVSALTAGRDSGLGALYEGRDTAIGSIEGGRDAALAEYDPYVEATSGAAGLYSDAIGLNGAGGNTRAVDAFQAGPGYEFAMDQGLTALDRRAASRGMLASGNNSIDTINYAQGLANQEYGEWLDRLRGQQEFGANIAGNRAGIITDAAGNVANIQTGVGGAAADLYAGTGAGIADLYSGTGANIAGVYTGTGGQLADVATGAGTRAAAIRTGLGDVKMGLGERKADLNYATRLGRAGVQADYLAGKDNSGMNIVGAVTGGASLGARLLGAG
jgi:hypothetical protein